VISAEENKYKPPPIPKEVSNNVSWIRYLPLMLYQLVGNCELIAIKMIPFKIIVKTINNDTGFHNILWYY
jgi:hypothetical protein